MGYDLKITNNFVYDVSAIGVTVKVGETKQIPYTQPNTFLIIPALNGISFLDIGEKTISGFSKKKNGLLISFGGEECEFRYNDDFDGIMNVTINEFGQAELTAIGDFCLVDLPNFVLPKGEE